MKTITNLNINSLVVKTDEELSIGNNIELKSLSIKISNEQHKKLKILSVCSGMTMSAIIRAFLEQFIDQYRKENVVDSEPGKQD